MIIYDRFWKTIKEKQVSTYELLKTYRISSSTLTRMRNNKPLTTTTLNDLCSILDCRLEDIAEYVPDQKE